MISILIPTFNYDVSQLVESLHAQAIQLDGPFEIVVYDDHSTKPVAANEAIGALPNAQFTMLPNNIGRSAIRNKLAHDAKYENLLFLDADTQVEHATFLQLYLNALSPTTEIIYGGIKYQPQPPAQDELLRWKYGTQREALPVAERRKEAHLRFLTLNFLIKKSVFEKIQFNEAIPNLRHEDTLFALDCKKKGISVAHIDNPVIHLGLESSSVFLRKSRESVEALHLFVSEGLIQAEETALSKKAHQLEKLKLTAPVAAFYRLFRRKMEHNLLSNDPSLLIFDVYRLGYYLSITTR